MLHNNTFGSSYHLPPPMQQHHHHPYISQRVYVDDDDAEVDDTDTYELELQRMHQLFEGGENSSSSSFSSKWNMAGTGEHITSTLTSEREVAATREVNVNSDSKSSTSNIIMSAASEVKSVVTENEWWDSVLSPRNNVYTYVTGTGTGTSLSSAEQVRLTNRATAATAATATATAASTVNISAVFEEGLAQFSGGNIQAAIAAFETVVREGETDRDLPCVQPQHLCCAVLYCTVFIFIVCLSVCLSVLIRVC